MRIVFLIVLSFFVQLSAFSQRNPVVILGTVPVYETTAMDATEVTIEEYTYFIINHQFNPALFPDFAKLSPSARLYFQELKKGTSNLFVKVVKNHALQAKSYGENGFTVTKAYNEFVNADSTGFTIYNPVVAVSFEQAMQFCAWRQENENKNRTVKLRISLPSPEIYQTLINNTDSIVTGKNECKQFQFNFSHKPCVSVQQEKDMQQQGVSLVRVDRFKPSQQKLYNMQGNAAEMTSVKGIAKGGSFRHSASASMNDQVQQYSEAEGWLGFRCYITLQEGFFIKPRS